MPTYRVNATYDMGMSPGGETIEFEASDNEAAKAYLKEHEGGSLGPIQRNVSFDMGTLSRVVE